MSMHVHTMTSQSAAFFSEYILPISTIVLDGSLNYRFHIDNQQYIFEKTST